jgi:hypothetical protein
MAFKTIILKGQEHFVRLEEYLADAALTPGHILELDSAGEVKKHATEGGYWDGSIASEDALQGREIDTDYDAADLVQTSITSRSVLMYAFLQATENVAIGEKLISAGDGTLKALSNVTSGVTVYQVVGIAEEALDLSGTGAVATRIKVRTY